MTNNKAREINSPIIKQLINETTAEELAKIDTEMSNNKQLSIIDALCIVKTGSRTEQERELLNHAYLVIEQHSEILHLEYQKEFIDEKLFKIKEDDKQ